MMMQSVRFLPLNFPDSTNKSSDKENCLIIGKTFDTLHTPVMCYCGCKYNDLGFYPEINMIMISMGLKEENTSACILCENMNQKKSLQPSQQLGELG